MNKTIVISFFLAFFSCQTQKPTSMFAYPVKTQDIISRVSSNTDTYKWIDLKGEISVKSKQIQTRFNIRIVNRKDSLIWFSARGPFGIEIFTGQITLDTISFIDRINKTYFHKPNDSIKEVVNADLSFYQIQQIFSANPKISHEKYELEQNDFGFRLISKKECFFITKDFKIQEVIWAENGNKVVLRLDEYQSSNNFPKKAFLKIENKNQIDLSIIFTRIKFNAPKKLIFKIPDSYVEI